MQKSERSPTLSSALLVNVFMVPSIAVDLNSCFDTIQCEFTKWSGDVQCKPKFLNGVNDLEFYKHTSLVFVNFGFEASICA